MLDQQWIDLIRYLLTHLTITFFEIAAELMNDGQTSTDVPFG